MKALLLVVLVPSLVWAGAAPVPSCKGERIAVLPLLPVATVGAVARIEEDRLRDELQQTPNLCVLTRAETLTALGNASPVACDDANCRRRLAERLDAKWVVWGTVFGFGARTSVSAMLWDDSGERVSRRSYEPKNGARITESLLAGARALPMAGVPERAPVTGRAVPLALAGTGVVALAAGLAFGAASAETGRQLADQNTGCTGQSDAYLRCLDDRVKLGRRQATTANVFYGVAAAFGIGAGITWAVHWP